MVLKLLIVCIICISVVIFLYIAGVIIYSSLVTINPEPESDASAYTGGEEITNHEKEITLMTWNIGYGGLGKEMDHFYEDGTMTRPSQLLSQKYIKGIREFIVRQDTVNFFLLQEVDFGSKRSFFRDQAKYLHEALGNYSGSIAINYKAGYVPLPVLDPMGRVSSGLVTLAGFSVVKSSRILSPATYSWPKRLFMIHRCLLISHYMTANGKELVIVNVHNSAYEDANKMRSAELKLIKSFALTEYEKGNYVIIGGDWNQNPPGLDLSVINKYQVHSVRPLEADFLPQDWKCAYYKSLPTNRDVNIPFNINTTLTSVLDYYWISPNTEVINIRAIDLGFEDSDHLPVIIKIKLK
jgi:endonuclease/exonuclease/phosphatase family metal-dependent hydrolase